VSVHRPVGGLGVALPDRGDDQVVLVEGVLGDPGVAQQPEQLKVAVQLGEDLAEVAVPGRGDDRLVELGVGAGEGAVRHRAGLVAGAHLGGEAGDLLDLAPPVPVGGQA
jgi:hypothetical protein